MEKQHSNYPDAYVVAYSGAPFNDIIRFSINDVDNYLETSRDGGLFTQTRRQMRIDSHQLEATVSYIREAFRDDILFLVPDDDESDIYDRIKATSANTIPSSEADKHLPQNNN